MLSEVLVLCSIPCPGLQKKIQAKIPNTATALMFSLSSCLIMGTYSLDKSSLTVKFLGHLISASEYCLGIDEAEQLDI